MTIRLESNIESVRKVRIRTAPKGRKLIGEAVYHPACGWLLKTKRGTLYAMTGRYGTREQYVRMRGSSNEGIATVLRDFGVIGNDDYLAHTEACKQARLAQKRRRAADRFVDAANDLGVPLTEQQEASVEEYS